MRIFEVATLRCPQRVFPEEGNHDPQQIGALADHVVEQVLAVVVMPSVLVDSTNAEERPQVLQAFRAPRALRHYKLMK